MKLKSRSKNVNKKLSGRPGRPEKVKSKASSQNIKLCVYCGSSSGRGSRYIEIARNLAQEMVKSRLDLVYGGGDVGLMGEVSREVMRLGGRVYGVIPRGLFAKEVASRNITRLYKVKDMHERKAKMQKLADAFIAIPGGFGTMDELFEIITWNQIGIHQKPVILLNYQGFYNPLLEQLRRMVKEGFIRAEHLEQMIVLKDLRGLRSRIQEYF